MKSGWSSKSLRRRNRDLLSGSSSSGPCFASGFLQIPPRDGHPCPRLYGSVLPPSVRDSHSTHRTCLAQSGGRGARVPVPPTSPDIRVRIRRFSSVLQLQMLSGEADKPLLSEPLVAHGFVCLWAPGHAPPTTTAPAQLAGRPGGTPKLIRNAVTDRPRFRCSSRTQRSFRRIDLSIRLRCIFGLA